MTVTRLSVYESIIIILYFFLLVSFMFALWLVLCKLLGCDNALKITLEPHHVNKCTRCMALYVDQQVHSVVVCVFVFSVVHPIIIIIQIIRNCRNCSMWGFFSFIFFRS